MNAGIQQSSVNHLAPEPAVYLVYVAVANCDPNIEGRCAVSPYAVAIVEAEEPEEEPEPEPETETLQPPRIEWVAVHRWVWGMLALSRI